MRNNEILLQKFGTDNSDNVKTFRDWIKVGRVVKKGEKGTRLARPVSVNGESSFRPYFVFHVSQTTVLGQ